MKTTKLKEKIMIGIKKIYFILGGDRTNPRFLSSCFMTFIALRKYITNFVDKYCTTGANILDFGCGNMIYKKFFLKKYNNINYYGLDIGDSPENNGKYQVYTQGILPYKDEKFDIIISTQVFEHLNDPFFYAKELERVCKKNGKILITIAHLWPYHPYPAHYFNIMKDAIPYLFKGSKILDIKGDTSYIQNIATQFMHVLLKLPIIGRILIMCINFIFWILSLLGISKIGPQKYNEGTGNILVTLEKI